VRRIVADTNVYISALNFAGTADEVLALGRARAIDIFISPPILDEVADVLVRKFRWTATRVREARRAIGSFASLISPGEVINVIREDEPDNRILECAVAAGAEAIVTGDQHILKLKRFRGIVMVSPREFLATR
jgi:putative PIN family toxin of toxin-antitoxin system